MDQRRMRSLVVATLFCSIACLTFGCTGDNGSPDPEPDASSDADSLGDALADSDAPDSDTQRSQFVSVWTTRYIGESDATQIRLPLLLEGEYDFTVDWGDGSSDTITHWHQDEAWHTYEEPGDYTVTIEGQIDGFAFQGEGDPKKLLEIKEWGPLKLGNSGGYFQGAEYLEITAADTPDLSGTTNMRSAFEDCHRLGEAPSMGDWDVSGVTDMGAMFRNAYSFNTDIGDWDTSSVQKMDDMFHNNTEFNRDIGDWDTSSVVTMRSMFSGASDFNQDIGAWDTSSVEDTIGMFKNALSFNQDIGGWDTSSVRFMSAMFENAEAFDQDLDDWDVANVYRMRSMFQSAGRFDQDLDSWDVSSVEDMENMFRGAERFNGSIGQWDVSDVTDFSGMFWGATNFNADISGWDVRSATNLSGMFAEATSFNQDIGDWPVYRVARMSSTFMRAENFDQDLGDWDVEDVTTMAGMFYEVTLSTPNYDAMLIGWAQQDVQPNVELDAGASTYSSAAVSARQTLTGEPNNWSILDGGPAADQ